LFTRDVYALKFTIFQKGSFQEHTATARSIGRAKALFEGALERSVEVIMKESIINGNKQCKLEIVL